MAQPIEQDIILDADGKPLFTALQYVEREVAKLQRSINKIGRDSYKNVQDVGKVIQDQTSQLAAALRELRTLTGIGTRAGDFEAAVKARSAESRAFYQNEDRDRRQRSRDRQRQIAADEREGTRIVAEQNRRRTQIEIESVKGLQKARIEAARAGLVDDAKAISNLRAMALARADNIDKLRRYREAAKVETDPVQQRALATLISLEKARGTALNSTNRALERQSQLADRRLARLDTRQAVAQAPFDVRDFARQTSAAEARSKAIAEQALARQRLLNATTAEQRTVALDLLRIANARVRAAEALVKAEERVANAQRREQEQQGRPSRLQNILTPGYAAAAFARTSIYGAAAMAAYGAFNTVQTGLGDVVRLEDEMQRLQAISNSTNSQMQVLRASILEIGSSSRYSLIDLTKISQTLAQAGVNAGQMEEVLRAVVTLAQASGSTPDEAVQLVTAALGAFQLQASEAARVADLMTAALNRTRLTVQQTALALQYVGATAFEQNISLEQMLATIGAIAQAGVRSGSTIGTGFRQFLVDLQNPSEDLTRQLQLLGLTSADVNVTVRGLPAVLETLNRAGFGAAQAYESLEVRAAAFYLTARNNVDIMDQLQLAFANQGAAAVANERAMDSLAAQWQRFKNIVEEGFSDELSTLVTIAKNVLSELNDALGRNPTGQPTRSPEDEWFGQAAVDTLDFLDSWLGGGEGIQGDEGLGTWLQNLGRDSSALTAETQRYAEAAQEANQRVEDQRNRIQELDREMQRLIVQKESLRNNDIRSAAEIATLTSRFQGLASHLQLTGNRYDDLTGAMSRYRAEQLRLLQIEMTGEQAALRTETAATRRSSGAALESVRSNPDMLRLMTRRERVALNMLDHAPINSEAFQQGQAILNDAVARLADSQPELSRLLSEIVQAAGTVASNTSRIAILSTQIQQTQAARQPYGQQVTSQIRNIQSLITQIGSRENSDAEKARLTSQVNRMINELERSLTGRMPNVRGGALEFVRSALADIPGIRRQVSALNAPTREEERADQRGAQQIQFGSPVRGTPRVTSGVGPRQAPMRGASTNHQGVDIAGNMGDPIYATADGVVIFAGRKGGYGNTIELSHGGGTSTLYGHLSGFTVQRGQVVQKGDQIGSMGRSGTATGVHLHYERRTRRGVDRNPLSGTAAGNVNEIETEAERLRQREEERAEREAVARERFALRTEEGELQDAIGDLRGMTTEDLFGVGRQTAQAALNAWAEQLREVSRAELERRDATASEAAEYMAEVEERIRQKAEEINEAIFAAFMNNIQVQLEAIDTDFTNAIQPSVTRLGIAEAQVSGLGYHSLSTRVPDYVRTLASARAAEAAEAADRARLAAMSAQISGREGVLSGLITRRDQGGLEPQQLRQINTEIAQLTSNLNELRGTRDALAAALGAGGLLPTSFNQGLEQAIAAFRELNNLNMTFAQQMTMQVGDAIDHVATSLTDMFTSIMDGSANALDAFANFAKSIMDWMAQIAARALAMQIMNLIFGAIAGASGSKVTSSSTTGLAGGFTSVGPGFLHGGTPLDIPGYAGGGEVVNGSADRDSVLARIAKGEWLIQKRAVDSVGHDFMARLNQHGARALDSLQGMPELSVNPVTDLKVYMVPPDQVPQLGPNDILLTWQQDVLSGGQSMRLIEHVIRENR